MQERNLPWLLFPNSTVMTSGEDSVYDLKLDALLPEGTAQYLRIKPTKESIMQRRELFSVLLEDSSAVDALVKLEELSTLALEAEERLKNAFDDNGRTFIFPEFAARMSELYKCAASYENYGSLFEQFSGVFKGELETEAFKRFESELSEITACRDKISALGVELDGERTRVTRDATLSLNSAVEACAERYGVEMVASPRTQQLVQKSLIDAATKLYPAEFSRMQEFYREFESFFMMGVSELIPQFKLAIGIVKLTERAGRAGIPYCFPELTDKKEIQLLDVYDPALLLKEGTGIVPNDVYFDSEEPFFYLTGANGGGKTTYLRAVGSAVLLLMFGAPVFCRAGRCCVLESVWTHFPKDERFDGSGRFVDEQRRIDEMLAACEANVGDGVSLLLLNETYSTTNEEKAKECTSELAHKLYSSGNFGLYITHQHGVNEQKVPFLGVTVDENDSNRRTYRIERKRLQSRSFASDVLLKYGISREALRELMLGKRDDTNNYGKNINAKDQSLKVDPDVI